MRINTQKDIIGIKKIMGITAECFSILQDFIAPGISTKDIEDKVMSHIASDEKYLGVYSAVKDYQGFPGYITVARNNVICHGIPSATEILKSGDIINVDISLLLNGYYSDMSRMYVVDECTDARKELIKVAKECQKIGVSMSQNGTSLYEIAERVEAYVNEHNYQVVSSFCGHGVGKVLHESPTIVYSLKNLPRDYRKKLKKTKLKEGMTITVEPIISEGSGDHLILEDNWTAVTTDGSWTAHVEDTIYISKTGPIYLC